jgi:hypothetical protein
MAAKKEKRNTVLAENKSRTKISKCPESVQKLIDKVNLVPFPTNMINLQLEIEYRTRRLREETGDSGALVSIREVLQDCLKDLPEDFHNYLKGFCYGSWLRSIDTSKAEFMDVHKMSQAYTTFYQDHNETIFFARRLKADRDGTSYPNNWETFPMRASGVMLKDENGDIYLDGLAGVIHEIIPDRFRMCEICNKIFWAKREESETCSAPCFGILRTRRYRNLTPEEKAERKAKREANKKIKKQLARNKEKMNGTL